MKAQFTSPSSLPSLRLFRAFLVLWILPALVPALLWAQDEESQDDETPAVVVSTGTAKLLFEGRQLASVPYARSPGGEVFDLASVAAVVGVEIVVGPLGDSHRLILKDREILVGPGQTVAVVARGDGGAPEKIEFTQPPIKGVSGLKVPLEFLTLALAEELGLDFTWNAESNALEVDRRQVRTLQVSVDVFHQHSTTVAFVFSAVPRYRVEQLDGAIEIRLAADRLALPVDTGRARSPLVQGVRVAADRLRIDLAEGAGAATPRLVEGAEVSLIVDVYSKTTPRETVEAATISGSPTIRTIVIDPGHGGVETGAVGRRGTTEKDLALSVARSLKRMIERRMRVRVVLTRAADADIPLETRTAIANQNKADLFISVHFNSYFGRKAHGAETYFLSREASDQLAAEVAEAENRVGSGENPESDLQLILWDLAQSYHLAESQRFAKLVQEELNLTLDLRNRGVKQAPFRVLMGAAMPAVLVELGFLSNPDEEAKLRSPIYQAELVDSLFRAIRRFKTQIEAEEAEEPVIEAAGPSASPGTGGLP